MTRPVHGGAAAATVTFVIGTTAGGTGEHVRTLAAGLARRGAVVTVAGPSSADRRLRFWSLPGVAFVPAEVTGRPRAADIATIARLRRTLASASEQALRRDVRSETGATSVVHAHGLRAGALTVLALARPPKPRRPKTGQPSPGQTSPGQTSPGRPGLVVTVHNAPPAGIARGLIYRLLERIVARSADLVLCVSPDLERRMRAAGARRTDRAVVASPDPPGHEPVPPGLNRLTTRPPATQPPRTQPPGIPADRPLVFAAGRLVTQKGFATLLEAAAGWQDLRPVPLLAIAGDGPLAASLRRKAAPLGDNVRFLGQRDDVPALLAAAQVFVLPSLWEGQPLVLQQALRAGAAIVATRVGGIPVLTGEDAALLVASGDAEALAAAVRKVLRDPAVAARLRNAARVRAATLPTENDAVQAALASYASATAAAATR
ncbi:MAG TPA: glycosyltransferase family 4 protein [Trebonia sp.]|nr:glycosyltransferase family 4 protein [Trebonia sp.]